MMTFENKFLRIVDRMYGWLVRIGSNLQSVFLLYMRLVWGHQLFIHGIEKLGHTDTVIQFFTTLNVPHSELTAYAVAIIETGGGLCLFLGLMSRLAAIPVMIVMISALSLAHSDAFIQWRFLVEPAMLVQQAPYPFLLTALLVFIFGPGRISLDAWLKRWANARAKY